MRRVLRIAALTLLVVVVGVAGLAFWGLPRQVPPEPHLPGTVVRGALVFGYDFDLLAEQHGFIVVYPQGFEGHWNDCKVRGSYSAHVYVTGVSNGGSMTI